MQNKILYLYITIFMKNCFHTKENNIIVYINIIFHYIY